MRFTSIAFALLAAATSFVNALPSAEVGVEAIAERGLVEARANDYRESSLPFPRCF
jgi:hypothetical protein